MFEIGDLLRWPYGRLLGRPMNFSFIDEYVAGSAKPMRKKEVKWLTKKGIGAILTIREEPLARDWVEGMSYLHVPVKNHTSPTQEELLQCVDFLISEESKERKTLVHCAAGSGRTGTVLAAYLCKRYGLGAQEAIAEARKKRPHSIEKNQEEAIKIFAGGLKQKP